jgi:hypothetical protein
MLLSLSIFLISVFVFTYLVVFIIKSTVEHSIHKSMTQECSECWGNGNFKQFLIEYKKVTWKRSSKYTKSHFSEDNSKNEIHASIIKFNGKGMCLDLWSYIRFRKWENKNKVSNFCGNW